MARIGLLALFAVGALMSGAASKYRILTLYPENQEAQALGRLTAHISGQGGSGKISLEMPNGEVLKGRFKVKVGGKVGAYGKSRGLDRPGGAYTDAGEAILHGNPAIVEMEGPSGLAVYCEVINDDPSTHGSGVCIFSNGAEYRVLY